MYLNLLLIAAGLGLLAALRWLRRRFQGWTRHKSDFRMVGYLLPLAGVGLVLTGIGMFWQPGDIGQDWLNNGLLFALLAGLLCFLLAFLAVLGVPMPALLLPRRYRVSHAEPPQSDPDGGVTP